MTAATHTSIVSTCGAGSLSVGSGLGFVLQAFRKDGWEVVGVEPDRNKARYASERVGIPTLDSTLEAARLPDDSVEAVATLHFIEHGEDPVGTLREIHRILKPGGHLILETPRYDTLMFRVLGRVERSLSCDGHIYFFTTESLRKAYTAAGFELDRLDYTGRSLTLDRLVYNLVVISKSKGIQRIAGALSRRARLNKFRVTINVRGIQRACLTEPVTS